MENTKNMSNALYGVGVTLLLSLTLTGYAVAKSCLPPPSGMVAWWPGDGDGIDIQGGNIGTLVNGASFATGVVDQALSFDGVDDAFVTPLVVSYSTGVSFDAWVMTLDDRGMIMSGGGGATLERGMGIFIEPGGILILHGTRNLNSQPNFRIQAGSISDGTFHHVTATWTGDTTPDGVRLYVDGGLVGMATAATSIGMDSLPLQIGGHTTIGHHKLAGVIDEVEVFNRVLSPSEILALYNAGGAGKCKVSTGCSPGCLAVLAALLGLAGLIAVCWWLLYRRQEDTHAEAKP